ncbi:MAG: dTDP-4-dehydrorhamnose 3,5-epimerase [Myxococcales bacterium SG8_38]|nr:MAG: dTDP-4-dehydrorhamnose 3,5-epimerase [Myxococcales bacterium SG8_38]
MKIQTTALPGLVIIEPAVFGDDRGFLMESYSRDRYAEAGLPREFVQDNVSLSAKGILRGLHLQHPNDQGKLCFVLEGEVFDVAVDVRVGSPTFGRWEGMILSSQNKRQLYIPPGFAHGFCVLSDRALFSYKCTDFYAARSELGVAWDDPDIGIEWPLQSPRLSAKDQKNQRLRDISPNRLPRYA